jgi:hypothetical protein
MIEKMETTIQSRFNMQIGVTNQKSCQKALSITPYRFMKSEQQLLDKMVLALAQKNLHSKFTHFIFESSKELVEISS